MKPRWQLLAVQMASLVCLLMLISLAAYALLRHQLYRRVEAEARTMARAVNFSVEHEADGRMEFGESIYFANRPDNLELNLNGSVQWLDPNGRVLVQRGGLEPPQQPLVDGLGVYSGEVFSFTLAARDNGRVYGFSRVLLSLEPLRSELHSLVGLLTLLGTITLVLAAGLGWWWTGRVLQPLHNAYSDLTLFTGSVSHELRSPLAALRTQSQSLLRHFEHLSAEEIREGLQELDEASHDMAQLVNDLLLFAQSRRELQGEPKPLSLRAVLEELQAGLGQRAERVSWPQEDATVMGYAPSLQIVFRNLLENAFNYSEADAPVEINWSTRKGWVEVTVRDHGIGMNAESCQRAFEAFWRADASRSRHAGGAGLGLAIVRNLVLAQGGQIQVSSRLGQGSEFHIALPSAERR